MRLITVLQLLVTVAVPVLVLAVLVVIAVQLGLLRRDLARRAALGIESGRDDASRAGIGDAASAGSERASA